MGRDETLNLIRALRAKADSTTYPHEAETFRAKASQLMAKHGIAETDLTAPVTLVTPRPAPPVNVEDLLRAFGVQFFVTGRFHNTGGNFNFVNVTFQ